VVVDLCRYDSMMVDDRRGPFGDSLPTFDRWVIDPVARRVTETRLDDRPQEFPRHNPTRRAPAASLRLHLRGAAGDRTCTVRSSSIDVEAGTTEAHEFGAGRGGAEPIVVPKADAAAEDDCWILTVVYDACHRLQRVVHPRRRRHHRPEVARIALPQRVPFGFHGNWVSTT
jgi:carotenoid cleavage dioxygenase-like enzyme